MSSTSRTPNLFRFATSELSQDAFLCWLAEWADPTNAQKDEWLHRLGQAFLTAIFAKHGRQLPEILQSVEIKKQFEGIDVLITLNGNIAICIEDKVGTSEHSDQLRRYLNQLEKHGITKDHLLAVYIQTGEQGSYYAVEDAGYVVMRRREIIALLHNYLLRGGTDSIVRDFHDYLADIERRVESFRDTPFEDWEKDWCLWQGFFSEIQRIMCKGQWGYVSNPRGGFLGYWWPGHKDQESEQYLQLELNKLCFKIYAPVPEKRQELRSQWTRRILDVAHEQGFPHVKPSRFRSGETMTVAVLDGDYRRIGADGLLDIDATIGTIRTALDVLACAVDAEKNFGTRQTLT